MSLFSCRHFILVLSTGGDEAQTNGLSIRSVIVASIGRIGSVPLLTVTDVSATIFMPLLYTVIEPAFAIIAACLPTYRPLFVWPRSRYSRATHPAVTDTLLYASGLPVQRTSQTTLPSSSGVSHPAPTSKQWESGLAQSPGFAEATLMRELYRDYEKESVVIASRITRTSSRTTNYSKPLEKWVELD